MTNVKWEEIIIVAPRVDVFENEELAFQGIETDIEKIERIMKNIAESYVAIRRGNEKDPEPKENNAEINTELKQPIPYPIIRRGSELFLYERLAGGGEQRLHNQLSLGAGGHMNPIEDETDFANILAINLERELEEELNIEDKDMQLTSIGLINDDLNEVGKVHLGILVIIDVAEGSSVTVREVDQLRGDWVKLSTLKSKAIYDRLESWSQIAVDTL